MMPLVAAALKSLSGVLLVAYPSVGGDMVVTAGMKPWEGCAECHSLDGVAPNSHFPNLAAQDPAYLKKQMQDFSNRRRRNDHGQMSYEARETKSKTLAAIVEYFANLPPAPPSHEKLAPAVASEGKRLVEEGERALKLPACNDCHGPNPKRRFVAGRLEAQRAAYLENELDDFKAGERTNDPRRVMQIIAQRMSQAEIVAVSRYLASEPLVGKGVAAR